MLHLKMAHTVLKVLDDCEDAHTQLQLFEKKHILQIKAKLEDLKRGK